MGLGTVGKTASPIASSFWSPLGCRNPKLFIEGLLERYIAEVQRLTPGASQAPGSSTVGSPSKPAPGSALVPAKAAATAGGSAATPAAAAAHSAAGAAAGAAVDGTAAAADLDLPLLLSAAAVAALQAQPGLAEHAVSLGYVDKLVRLLAARAPALPPGGLTAELLDAEPLLPGKETHGGLAAVGRGGLGRWAPGTWMECSTCLLPHSGHTERASLCPKHPVSLTPCADEVSGSLLRLLHQLSSCLAAAEALARCTPPAVPPLLGALRWGTGAAGEGDQGCAAQGEALWVGVGD